MGGISNLFYKLCSPHKNTTSLLMDARSKCQHFVISYHMHQNLKTKLFNEHFKTLGTSRMFENKNEKSSINERVMSRLNVESDRRCSFKIMVFPFLSKFLHTKMCAVAKLRIPFDARFCFL